MGRITLNFIWYRENNTLGVFVQISFSYLAIYLCHLGTNAWFSGAENSLSRLLNRWCTTSCTSVLVQNPFPSECFRKPNRRKSLGVNPESKEDRAKRRNQVFPKRLSLHPKFFLRSMFAAWSPSWNVLFWACCLATVPHLLQSVTELCVNRYCYQWISSCSFGSVYSNFPAFIWFTR